MKVLHVIPTLDHVSGGPAIALAGLAEALTLAGVEVSVLIGTENTRDPGLVAEVRAAGPKVTALDAAPHAGDALAAAVAACDVCHIHAIWEGMLHRAAVACRRIGRPHVFRPCGMLDPWCLAQGRLKKRLYIALRLRRDLDRCSLIHFMTPTERDLVRPLGFRAPVVVEGNGVDLAAFAGRPSPGAFRQTHPAVGDRPLLLFLSRVHPKKGLDLLVPAFARLATPDAVLVIAGPDEGGYRAKVEAMARDAGVGERVLFTGMLHGRDKLAALVDADLFVLPSYQENFGVAVVEALAAGTPVIVSDQVNLHDAITEGRVGAVVPTEVGSLAREIDRWLGDAALREDAAARCEAVVRARFDWREIARRWAERYALLARGEPVV